MPYVLVPVVLQWDVIVLDDCVAAQRRNPGYTQTELSHSTYGDPAQSHRGRKIPDILQTDISNLDIKHK